ncbi:hypothetical protein SAMN05192534_10815 [Alteribacillus persepolensis]|uniref:Uncharacterized protein n=1 Tax=Alteribacillus persepolensis TaxID=568899 RepID=A0A1G8DSW8_9BACI|nr:hypothetical protein [Alteribacillus persepolensis]SDH60796.1 hypothetical protein SAMN05192534_10815 [Alteribacillus persepolensis]
MSEETQFSGYTAADLKAEQLERVKALESELRETTRQDIVLIAYEEDESH